VIEKSPDGMTPAEEVAAIRQALIPLIPLQHDLFQNHLLPALAEAGIVIADYATLTEAQQNELCD
jgi:polyphosphate kinase